MGNIDSLPQLINMTMNVGENTKPHPGGPSVFVLWVVCMQSMLPPAFLHDTRAIPWQAIVPERLDKRQPCVDHQTLVVDRRPIHG